MSRAWIVLVALGAASCAEFRNFTCYHCAKPTHAKGPGESLCQSCFRTNVLSVCPSCGTEESQPGLGPFRCGSCGAQAYATKCRSCSTVSFSLSPDAACAACVRPPPPASAEVAALKRSAGAHAEGGDLEAAIGAYDAALRLEPKDANARYALACVLARAGKNDRALDEAERAVRDGYSNWDLIRKDPDLAPLRAHPRWIRLMKAAPDERP